MLVSSFQLTDNKVAAHRDVMAAHQLVLDVEIVLQGGLSSALLRDVYPCRNGTFLEEGWIALHLARYPCTPNHLHDLHAAAQRSDLSFIFWWMRCSSIRQCPDTELKAMNSKAVSCPSLHKSLYCVCQRSQMRLYLRRILRSVPSGPFEHFLLQRIFAVPEHP